MRLFTGVSLPPAVAENLTRLVQRLRPTAKINWAPPENLHLTTKFIGHWPDERLPELIRHLEPLCHRPPPAIRARNIGWFPNPHHPRILFVGIQAGSDLEALAADTDRALQPLGVEPENRKYAPHLTLARIKDASIPLAALRQEIAAVEDQDFGSWVAQGFHLYSSKPGSKGSVYTQIADFPFPADNG
jgi:2'-5' RNA ligase